MTLKLHEVAKAMRAAGVPPDRDVAGWSVDTRTQNPGDVYFALRGENLDGHAFVPAAIEKGAAAVVVDHPTVGQTNVFCGLPFACELLVQDTLTALQESAAWARARWDGDVVAVTGSAGKTTTKDAIAQLLSTEFPVGRTIGNLNNHVGLPLSILRLPDDCRAAVLEVGMNHAGEIQKLACIARPDFGVVTNVGYAHVEFFDSIQSVAAAKRELIEGLPRTGVAVLNADDPLVSRFAEAHPGRTVTFGISEPADVRAENVDYRTEVTRFRVNGVDFETGLSGRHAVMNLLAAIAVAREFGIPLEKLREPVREFAVGRMRGERIEHNGITVWNDCYNSNPEAAQSMIDVLRITPAARRIAVLGEMLELGHAADTLHRALGEYAATHGVDILIGVRGHAQAMTEAASASGLPASSVHFFADAPEAGDFVKEIARAGDAILFKGSRGVHVERSLERFLA